MTWGEVKLAALQKMFSAEGQTINQNDEGVRDYVNAMPQAANEAMQLICTAGKALRKSATLTTENGPLDLKKEISDLYRMGVPPEVYLQRENGGLEELRGAQLLGGRYLSLPAGVYGQLLLFYDAWPPVVTLSTPDETELPLDPEAAVLLPLYIASQLYKDDDISIATMYRNEFETAFELLRDGQTGTEGGEFTSVTGWV